MFSPCLKSAAVSTFPRTIAAYMQLRFCWPLRRRFAPQPNREPLTERSPEMPLLEIVQTRQITATIRLDESTAEQIDQYAAFLHASADEVVDKALAYVFAKDRDFQEFLRTPETAGLAHSVSKYQMLYVSDGVSDRRAALEADVQPGATPPSGGPSIPLTLTP